MQDTLEKAREFETSGDTGKARRHWEFAVEVATGGLARADEGAAPLPLHDVRRSKLQRWLAEATRRCAIRSASL